MNFNDVVVEEDFVVVVDDREAVLEIGAKAPQPEATTPRTKAIKTLLIFFGLRRMDV